MQLAEIVQRFHRSKSMYRFFDINCWTVSSEREQLQPVIGVEALIQSLDAQQIHEAVVTSAECLEYNASVGNENLLSLIAPFESLSGSIVWVPELAGTRNDSLSYIERMIANKVVSVRMFPKKLRYSMNKWQVGDVLKVMEAKRLPLILWHMETSWDTVNGICESYPNLPVIIEGNDQKLLYHNRSYIPLLAQHPNLYIETHSLIQHGEIEYIVNKCGIDRLLFGTYFPYNDPNGSMMMITDAEIPEETKYKIAGDNMRSLIGQITS
ncbi:amidohydrolase family protein [Cohnella silvisoli]|uniref:amidohydrolase family protein n=1 Tax=Cohnella silvisoli TaxID=2873699 RepID=UPI0032DA36F3